MKGNKNMGYDDFQKEANKIHLFCNSRGLGAEVKDHLMQRAIDWMQDFDAMVRDAPNSEHRLVPLSDAQLEQWHSQMDEPTLF
jgi:hypothetical protein